MHIKKIFRLFLALPVILIFLTGCGPSQKEKMQIAETACATIFATRKFESAKRIEVLNKAREEVGDYDGPYPLSDDILWMSLTYGGKQSCIDKIIEPPPPPPKTKAELEAEAAAEEARAKRAEEERIAKEKAEAEAKRKAEERAKYIAENTKTTYLYCPFVPRGRAISSNTIMLFKLNKIDDEYLPSVARTIFNSPASSDYQDCDWSGAIREPCETVRMDNGSMTQTFWTGTTSLEKPYSKIYEYKEGSTSYGHKILIFGSSYRGFILDRVNLHATTQESELGDNYYSYYQCEVSSKEVYDKKIQEATDRLNVAVEAEKTKLKEKQSQETQI